MRVSMILRSLFAAVSDANRLTCPLDEAHAAAGVEIFLFVVALDSSPRRQMPVWLASPTRSVLLFRLSGCFPLGRQSHPGIA